MFDLRITVLVVLVIIIAMVLAYLTARYREDYVKTGLAVDERSTMESVSTLMDESRRLLGEISPFQRTFFGLLGAILIVSDILIFMPAIYIVTQSTYTSGVSSWIIILVILAFGINFLVTSILNRGFLSRLTLMTTAIFTSAFLIIDLYPLVVSLTGDINTKIVGYEAKTGYILYSIIGPINIFGLNISPIFVYVLFPIVLIVFLGVFAYFGFIKKKESAFDIGGVEQ